MRNICVKNVYGNNFRQNPTVYIQKTRMQQS